MNENSVKIAILKIKILAATGRKFNLYVGVSVRLCVKSPYIFREVKKMPNEDLKINSAIVGLSFCSCRLCPLLCHRIAIERQTNRESRSLARLTVHDNPAAMRFDNTIANRKAKTQSTPLLCGKKWLKN